MRAALPIFAAALDLAAASASVGKAETAEAEWVAYKAKFIAPEGRVVDEAGGKNVSHSEGQGYGMLLAAFNGDQETFDRLWRWTNANLYVRGDDLAAWRWRPDDNPHVLDRNNATDGDILIAWALAEAAKRWKRPDYAERAHRIARTIGWSLTYEAAFGRALSPGAAGFGPKDGADGPVVNPSYWIFPAFSALAKATPEVDWDRIGDGGRALLDGARFGPQHLPSDWVSLKNGLKPANGFPARFSYDAIRVPLYLVWASPGDRSRLEPFLDGWAGQADEPPPIVSLDGSPSPGRFEAKGYRAIAALLRCALNGAPIPADLLTPDFDVYYPSTLHMLALVAARQRLPQCLQE